MTGACMGAGLGPLGAGAGFAGGILTAYGAEKIVETGLLSGIEQSAQWARNQGTSAEESQEFENVIYDSVNLAGNVLAIKGVGKKLKGAKASKTGKVEKGSFSQSHQGETPLLATDQGRKGAGTAQKVSGNLVELTLEFKEGMNPRDYDRKVRALQDLAERGKLVKAPNPLQRKKALTRKYRKDLLQKAEKKWAGSDPEKYERIKSKIQNMHVDHQHELQLLGKDVNTNLGLLDGEVNTEIGRQIRSQIKNLKDFTKISSVKKK